MGRWLFVLSVMGCGRIDFDPMAAARDAVAADAEPAGLLLHLAFESDGFLRDRSSGHHDAACATTCPVSAAGQVGAAAASFSNGACLEVADASDLHPGSFTYAVWYRPDASGLGTAFGRPFDGANAGTNTFEAFTDVSDVWKVAVNTTAIKATLDHGTWHHLAGTFDATTLVMYVDGVAQGAPLTVGPVAYGADNITVGCDVNSGVHSNSATGLIDDVRLYDHVLSAGDMQLLANER